MAKADYMLCAHCDQKAYYDANIDYRGAYVVALCDECAQYWTLDLVATTN